MSGSMSETVNAWIDNLLATGDRMLELPMFMVMGGAGICGAVMILAMGRLAKKPGAARWMRGLKYGLAGLIVLMVVYAFDRKMARVQAEVRELRARASTEAMGQASTRAADTGQSLGDPGRSLAHGSVSTQ